MRATEALCHFRSHRFYAHWKMEAYSLPLIADAEVRCCSYSTSEPLPPLPVSIIPASLPESRHSVSDRVRPTAMNAVQRDKSLRQYKQAHDRVHVPSTGAMNVPVLAHIVNSAKSIVDVSSQSSGQYSRLRDAPFPGVPAIADLPGLAMSNPTVLIKRSRVCTTLQKQINLFLLLLLFL